MTEKLQIICFKMDTPQLDQVDGLIKDLLYFSRSEVLRVAIRHLLMRIANDPSVVSISSLSWNSFKSDASRTKDSVSSKLPPVLLKCVDDV